jgi:hypothetical protein
MTLSLPANRRVGHVILASTGAPSHAAQMDRKPATQEPDLGESRFARTTDPYAFPSPPFVAGFAFLGLGSFQNG